MQHNFCKAFEDVGARSKSTMKENAAARTVVRQPGLHLCGCSNMQVQLETTFFNQMLVQCWHDISARLSEKEKQGSRKNCHPLSILT